MFSVVCVGDADIMEGVVVIIGFVNGLIALIMGLIMGLIIEPMIGLTIGLIIGMGDEPGIGVTGGMKVDSVSASPVIWGSRDVRASHGISA